MKEFKIGIQMYSVRDEIEKGMESALKRIADMGYDCVEFAGYYGEAAESLKEMLDKYGLEAKSVHDSYEDLLVNPEEKLRFLKTIGVKFFAIPKLAKDKHKGSEVFEKTVADIKKAANILKENGIQMLYHNHEFEFDEYEGKCLMDWLFGEISPELMNPEIDTCWVNFAGINPCEYIERYSGKTEVIHLKDFVCRNIEGLPLYEKVAEMKKEGQTVTREGSGFEYRPVGSGAQNFEDIIKSAKKAGTKYLIVEQDFHPERTPFEDAEISVNFLKALLAK